MEESYFYERAKVVTPSDSPAATLFVDDGFPHARALVFGGSGTVSFVTSGGDTVSGFAVSAGQELRLGIVRVLATGTSATPILALA